MEFLFHESPNRFVKGAGLWPAPYVKRQTLSVMEPHVLLGYVAISLLALFWVGTFLSWCFAAYYMIKTIRRLHPERRWGQYLPFSLFMPSFFTSEGNVYRAKLLRALGLFCFFVGVQWVIVLSGQFASP
ncbi:hypothetical protein [Roseateles sp. BYS96W]|uniref:Uncharacterized protein n=1 Tax=Pelomonas nitida TaxID=3299027 RepID=A0ABW7GBS1_9BURK